MLTALTGLTALLVGTGLLYGRGDWSSALLGWAVMGAFFYLLPPSIRWSDSEEPSYRVFSLAILTVVASVLQSFLLLSGVLTISLWFWLEKGLDEVAKARLRRLLILPFCALPWLSYDLSAIGWYFRLTAAWFTDALLSVMGFEVTRSGTELQLATFCLRVDPACSGLSFLHALILVGAYLIACSDRQSRPWTFYLWLFPLAWFANSLRVTLLALAALTWGPQSVAGDIHLWIGWACFVALFALWWRFVGERAVQ